MDIYDVKGTSFSAKEMETLGCAAELFSCSKNISACKLPGKGEVSRWPSREKSPKTVMTSSTSSNIVNFSPLKSSFSKAECEKVKRSAGLVQQEEKARSRKRQVEVPESGVGQSIILG